jgi:hypothetical protein
VGHAVAVDLQKFEFDQIRVPVDGGKRVHAKIGYYLTLELSPFYGHQETWEDAINEQGHQQATRQEEVLHQFGVQTPRGSWRRSNP